MDLVVDIGNTRLKWALADRGAVTRVLPPVVHGEADWLDALARVAAELAAPRGVRIAAVAAEGAVVAAEAVFARCWPGVPVERVRTRAERLGVRIAYEEPERLGVDRFLALLAARARERGPCVVASLGTALAIDALDSSGLHLGGLIAPSPGLMRASVLERTARVGWRRDGRVVPFATNSEDGLESGCWLAAAALVERSIDDVARDHGRCAALLTGGGADALRPLVRRECQVVGTLVLDGLALDATRQ